MRLLLTRSGPSQSMGSTATAIAWQPAILARSWASPRRSTPKAEVVPHGDAACVQLAHQHLRDKILRAEGCQGRIEGHEHQLADAHRLEQGQLFRRQVQA